MEWHGQGLQRRGSSHASVQRLRKTRAGLPVHALVRTVSSTPAFRKLSFCAGWACASSTVSRGPVHTPAAPIDIAASICRPLPMPPAAKTGSGGNGVDNVGPQHHAAYLARVPTPSVPCATTKSNPASRCRMACLRLPHSAPIKRPLSFTCLMTSAGGVPKALAISRHWGLVRGLLSGKALRFVASSRIFFRSPSFRPCRNAMLFEQSLGKGEMLVGHHRPQLLLQFPLCEASSSRPT